MQVCATPRREDGWHFSQATDTPAREAVNPTSMSHRRVAADAECTTVPFSAGYTSAVPTALQLICVKIYH